MPNQALSTIERVCGFERVDDVALPNHRTRFASDAY